MEVMKCLFVLALLAGFAYADVILPDSHPVTHKLYIDNIADYSEYQFLIYPTSMSGGAVLVTSSEVPGFYKFAQPKLYAVPRSEMPANFSGETYVPPEDALVSDVALHRTDSLPNTDLRVTLETHYTVSIAEGKLMFTEVSRSAQCMERGPDYWLLLLGLGVGLVLGYLAGRKL